MESTKNKKTLKVDPEFCKECGICIAVCPKGALSFYNESVVTVDAEKCVACGTCVQICPDYALSFQEGER